MPTIRLRLHESDRRRLGCPEWLEVDPASITNREAVTIREVLGFPTPGLMRDALVSRPVHDPSGGEVLYSTGVAAESVNEMAWTGLTWVALRRNGIDTDLATLEFSYELVDVDFPKSAELVETPGKAPARRRSTRSTKRS